MFLFDIKPTRTFLCVQSITNLSFDSFIFIPMSISIVCSCIAYTGVFSLTWTSTSNTDRTRKGPWGLKKSIVFQFPSRTFTTVTGPPTTKTNTLHPDFPSLSLSVDQYHQPSKKIQCPTRCSWLKFTRQYRHFGWNQTAGIDCWILHFFLDGWTMACVCQTFEASRFNHKQRGWKKSKKISRCRVERKRLRRRWII